jgi:hypothetical protein
VRIVFDTNVLFSAFVAYGAWEPVDDQHAALLYEREWATALLNQVLDRLEGEYLARGRRKVFESLQPMLLDRKGDRTYAELGAALGMSEDAVKGEVSGGNHWSWAESPRAAMN